MTILLPYLYILFILLLAFFAGFLIHQWIHLEIKDFLKTMDTNPPILNNKKRPNTTMPSLAETKRKLFQSSLVHLTRKRHHG